MKPQTMAALLCLAGCGAPGAPAARGPRPATPVAPPASQKAATVDLAVAARRACETGSAARCLEVTDRLARGKGDTDQTVQRLFRRACGGGSDAACMRLRSKSKVQKRADLVVAALTDMAQRNKKTGTTGEPLRAVSLRCDGGDGAACAEAALRHEDGKGVPKDAKKGHRFHRLACALGHWFSCNNLTLIYKDSLGEKLSRRMFSRMCESGSAYGCYWIAARLMSGLGGLPKRPKQGLELMKRACDGGHGPACYSVALRQADESKKRALLQRGCKGGCPDSCEELKHAADTSSELATARKACLKGRAVGCYTAAKKLMEVTLANVNSLPRRQKRAVAYLTKACQMKHGPACTGLGDCYASGKGVLEDDKRAARLYDRGCKLGDPQGCSNLALAHDLGEGVKEDAPRAMALYDKACRARLLSACESLGERHLDSGASPRNRREGARLLLRACKGGRLEACEGNGLVLRALNKLVRASKDDVVVRYSLQQLMYDLSNRKPERFRPKHYARIRKDCKARKTHACAVKRLVDRNSIR